MSYIPTVEQAKELVGRFNKDAFHLQHAETVSKVMGELAKEFDPERVDFWAAVGMLHDIDFELYPEQHCVKANEMLHELDIDEEMIHAVISHGYGICIDVEPTQFMEKVLYAADELTPYRRGCAHAPQRHFRHGGKVNQEEIQGQEVCSRLLARCNNPRCGDARLGA